MPTASFHAVLIATCILVSGCQTAKVADEPPPAIGTPGRLGYELAQRPGTSLAQIKREQADILYPPATRAPIEKRNDELFNAAARCTLQAAALYALATNESATSIVSASWDRCRTEWKVWIDHWGQMKWQTSAEASPDTKERVTREVLTPRVLRAIIEARAKRNIDQAAPPAQPPQPRASPEPKKPEISI